MDGLSIRKADEADQLIMTAGKWKGYLKHLSLCSMRC